MAVNEGNIHYVEFRGDTSQLRKEIDLLTQKFNQLNSSTSQNTQAIANSTKNMASSMSSSFKSISSAISGFGIVVGLQSIGRALTAMVSASAEMETTRTTFRVFTGSVETADKVLQQLKQSALESPLNFQDFVQGARTLMGYGVSAQQVVPVVKMLGDVSGGSADRFQRLSLAFGQVVGAGRLMGQEARQMINAGFNPLQFIAEKTGKSFSQLSDEMKRGQISVQDVADAFVTATSQGGRFYNLSQEITNTLGGQWNKLKEQLFFTFAEIGDSLSKSFDLKGVIDGISSSIATLTPIIKDAFSALGNSQILSTLTKLLGLIPTVIGYIVNLSTNIFKLGDGILKITISGIDSFMEVLSNIFSSTSDSVPPLTDNVKSLNDEFNKFDPKVIEKYTDNLNKFTDASIKAKLTNGLSLGLDNAVTKEGMANLLNNIKNFPTLKPIVSGDKSASGFSSTGKGKSEKEIQAEEKRRIKEIDRQNKLNQRLVNNENELSKKLLDIKRKFYDDVANEASKDFIYNASIGLTQRQKEILDTTVHYFKLLQLAKIYGADVAKITEQYYGSVNNIERNFAQKRFDDLKANLAKFLGPVKEQIKGTFDLLFSESNAIIENTVENLNNEKVLNRLTTFAESFNSAIQDFAEQAPALFGQALGEMVATQESFGNIIGNLGKILLGAFGKLLQQLGGALITLGISSKVFQDTITKMFVPGNPASPVGAIIAGTALVAAGAALAKLGSLSGAKSTKAPSMGSGSMTTGKTYQYGGPNFSTSSIKLSIDLTGSITASPTGYNINKQYETIARVTGR